jgi:hypothetical protein
VAQLSRPFQIALGALLLLALVFVMAARLHGTSPSASSSTSTPTPAPHATRVATDASAAHNDSTTVARNSSARATGRPVAHKTDSHQHVVAHKTQSHQRVVVHMAHTHAGATAVVVPPTVTHTSKPVVRSSTHQAGHVKGQSPSADAHSKIPAGQVAVEGELAQGKTVLLVFWNPKTPVDREVQAQARTLADGSKGTVAVHSALANQVDTFGSITEVAHVYQTPTILIVNRHGVVSTLTGLTDAYALQQSVHAAQQAGS